MIWCHPKKGSTLMKGLSTENVTELKAAIKDALQHLPDTANEDQVIGWLRERRAWVFE